MDCSLHPVYMDDSIHPFTKTLLDCPPMRHQTRLGGYVGCHYPIIPTNSMCVGEIEETRCGLSLHIVGDSREPAAESMSWRSRDWSPCSHRTLSPMRPYGKVLRPYFGHYQMLASHRVHAVIVCSKTQGGRKLICSRSSAPVKLWSVQECCGTSLLWACDSVENRK